MRKFRHILNLINMRKFIPVSTALSVLLFCNLSSAVDRQPDMDLPRGLEKAGKEFISPVTTDAAPYFWYGSALTLTLAIFEDQIGDPTQEDVAEDKPLGGASVIGDLAGQWIPNGLYMIGMYTHHLFTRNETSKERSIHMLKSSAYASGLATILKFIVREPRPNSDSKASFPSGHTTTAFAFATVIATQHAWYWSVPAYALASLTAFSRMNDNNHFLHDVIGGAAIGISYGLSIYFLNHDEASANNKLAYISPLHDGATLNFIQFF